MGDASCHKLQGRTAHANDEDAELDWLDHKFNGDVQIALSTTNKYGANLSLSI
jgi:hypothetical protein